MDNFQTKKRAMEFLKKNSTMVVATVNVFGEPQASVVYFYPDSEFNLYFMTSVGSKKYENIISSGKAAFVVGSGPDVITIQGGGNVQQLDEKEAEVFNNLIEKAVKPNDQWPLLTLSKKGFATFKITPSWMVMLNLHKGDFKEEMKEGFQKII